ncbi:NAD(P)-dependent oxidoreductase [Sulfuriferula plumbiphila]|uniref:dTDP-4-dehydrorhamnose reductase n=1 Tax=Sulfuriferula plumbiphila TaxID=171865 RepID=A0A512LAK8_9PROT|nr:dTDP-4-dehydrorhamnose reductase [Sulfuriferula plumbiphila]BBP04941.1 NAD(P)-dependent oxidoreductase [Sulfuriferula plumbiphila]GEP31492.1 NAD(P)-dependent oxidoreductase [Sulfuriferula plumbiphila]
MNILLTGVNGQVGWELRRTLATLGKVSAPTRSQLDLTDPGAIRSLIRSLRPNLIVNPAAHTAVDKAESEPELARAVNAIAPAIMAEEVAKLGAAMIHYSTDYVFDGNKPGAYTEDDTTHPLGVYGQTKLEGENAIRAAAIPHLILRTSWVYGLRAGNFLLTMQRLFKEREQLRIVADQYGAPTWSRMIAEATAQILAQQPFGQGKEALHGTYHLSSRGRASWYQFAQAILDQTTQAGAKRPELIPIPSTDYPTPARRPANSVLAGDKLLRSFGLLLPDWDAALGLCLDKPEKET